VLRAHPDVRRYAQLLLLAGQRAAASPWASRAVVTTVAPLQPQASHLAERIATMTQSRTSRSLARTALLAVGSALAAAVALALPTRRAAVQERAVVRLTSVGLDGVALSSDGEMTGTVLVFATGAARVGIGTATPTRLTDTLRLKMLPAVTADVTDGEVHIVLVGPGRMSMGGDVTGGPATHVTGAGRHLTILQGGAGIRALP
jgi:hypothetical protein